MTLSINTTQGDQVMIAIEQGRRVIATKKFTAKYKQAEKLLPEIDRLLKSKKLSLSKIKKIKVDNRGGSFTALRIGVVTANALGYATRKPVQGVTKSYKKLPKVTKGFKRFNIVEPIYNKEPNITKKN